MDSYRDVKLFFEACKDCHRMLSLEKEDIYQHSSTEDGAYFLCSKCNSTANPYKPNQPKFYFLIQWNPDSKAEWLKKFDQKVQLEEFLSTKCGKDTNDLLVFYGTCPDLDYLRRAVIGAH